MQFLNKSGTRVTGSQRWLQAIKEGDGEYKTNYSKFNYFGEFSEKNGLPVAVGFKSKEYRGWQVPLQRMIRKFGPTPSESIDAQFDVTRKDNTITIRSELQDFATATKLSDEEMTPMQQQLGLTEKIKKFTGEQADHFTRCSMVGEAFLDVDKRQSGQNSHYSCTSEMSEKQFNQFLQLYKHPR